MISRNIFYIISIIAKWIVVSAQDSQSENDQDLPTTSHRQDVISNKMEGNTFSTVMHKKTRQFIPGGFSQQFGTESSTPSTSTSPLTAQSVSSTTIPPKWFCYFYTNLTYTCKTNCDPNDGERIARNFTNDPRMMYFDMDCKEDLHLPEKRWAGQDGIIKWSVNLKREGELIATCSFYTTMEFECSGVTNCKEAENENRCASAAPWAGSYIGSPKKGFKSNGTLTKIVT
ncbi:hypothetical protein BV898_17458 [Hypsibius exemplaris]|uniref:Uncharacterized protein n=1 Tax=Hypsibius exemplaris TaxID=2072580 RepID=A0A9X6NF38_HYPEX|nr:hypothetical protein BV898_17458 [Hypsibius exemplaris]